MKHIVIITGGHLDINFAKEYLKTLSYDRVFAVDKGLEYADAMGMIPDYLIGDFDTVDKGLLTLYESRISKGDINSKMERYPAKKDATDTELAIETALECGADHITILAATGSRMDHVLANIGLLLRMANQNAKAYIVDETNRIQVLIGAGLSTCVIKKEEQFGEYVSLVPLTPIVRGITLKGAMYPLTNATIKQGSSLTISNQIKEEQIEIIIEKGSVLVIESKDK